MGQSRPKFGMEGVDRCTPNLEETWGCRTQKKSCRYLPAVWFEHSARKSSLYLTFCTESNCIGSLRFCIRPHLVKSLTYTFKATKVPGYDDILPKVVKSVMKLLRTDFAVQWNCVEFTGDGSYLRSQLI